jgi:hypothetical protein
MKKLLLGTVLCLPLIAQAGWSDASGKPIPDTESMKSDGDFGVHLVLTPDDKQFRQSWAASKEKPKLDSVSSVKIGGKIGAMLIFQGCWPSATGVCDVVSEFTVESPDGEKTAVGGGPVSNQPPLAPGILQLGNASAGIGMSEKDPVGDYKLHAVVTDKIKGRTLNLVVRFKVTH